MIFRTILVLFSILIVCSCAQQLQTEKSPNQHLKSNSGLLFEHGGYRGTGYTDSLGINYNLRYNPITITNDSTIPIQVQIAFSKEYDYPMGYGDEKFRIILLPKEWAQDGTTDSMFDLMWLEFENHIDRPLLSETIEPGENLVLAIGTLYPLPAEIWWVVPNELFAHDDEGSLPTCAFSTFDWLMNKDPSSNPEITLGLKLHLDERCMIIPCGQISYPER